MDGTRPTLFNQQHNASTNAKADRTKNPSFIIRLRQSGTERLIFQP